MLFRSLIPGPYDQPQESALDAGSQLPMPAELLEGVRRFLRGEVAESSDGRSSFLARVAANSLGIVQRELLYGPALAREEFARLQQLLGHGELEEMRWTLVRSLRADLALETPGLAEHLRSTVSGQLAIDQPHYSALAP